MSLPTLEDGETFVGIGIGIGFGVGFGVGFGLGIGIGVTLRARTETSLNRAVWRQVRFRTDYVPNRNGSGRLGFR